MTIRHLKIFVAVFEEGGITKAGNKLFLAQPSVSLAISEMEKHYRTKLFDRISKKLYLTEAGERLLPYARQILSVFDEMDSVSSDLSNTGTLRIASSITISNRLLPELLSKYSLVYPDIDTRVNVTNSSEVEAYVLENKADVGLIEGFSHSPMILGEVFMTDELVLVFSPSHRWADRDFVDLSELSSEPLLMREQGSGAREILENILFLNKIVITPKWESISTQAIVNAAVKGLGIAILPKLMTEDHINKGLLVTKPISGVSLRRELSVITHKSRYLANFVKEFISICTSH
ncbi:MAG: LysR family transcriptional regulator [Eubacteriales bacterium]|nr:LysR family transcriptional regulator [Eubacteriales bacterium]MDD4717446.1 LysR family transcriptional regulator [Eubacteriales bacterium]